MKKVFILSLLVLPILLVAPKAQAIAVWSEDAIKAVCVDTVSELQQSGVLPINSNLSAGSGQPDFSLEGRVAALENRMSVVEQLVNVVIGLLNQIVGMISGLVK